MNSVFSTSLSLSMVAVSARRFQSKIFIVMVDGEVGLVLRPLLDVNDDGENATGVCVLMGVRFVEMLFRFGDGKRCGSRVRLEGEKKYVRK